MKGPGRGIEVHIGLRVKVLALLLVVTLLSGCWSRRELDRLAIVTGLGIDLGADPGAVRVTVQIIKPGSFKKSGDSGGGGTTRATWVAVAEGVTVFDAIRNLTLGSSRKPYWGHNQVIIIGREVAEIGVRPFLNKIMNNPEDRPTVQILIAENKAQEILQVDSGLENASAIELAKMVTGSGATSKVPIVDVHRFTEVLVNKTTASVAPIVRVAKGPDDMNRLQLSGAAIFRQDRLAGSLSPSEVRGMLWVTGEVESGIVAVPLSDGLSVSMEVIRSKSSVDVSVTGSDVSVSILVRVETNLGAQMSQKDLSKPEAVATLNELQAESIKREIMAALVKSRKVGADIFGFGDYVNREAPEKWKTLESQWDSEYKRIPVKISVEVQTRQIGLLLKPVLPTD